MKLGRDRMKRNMMGRKHHDAEYGGAKSNVSMGSGKAKTGLEDTKSPNMSYDKAGAKVVTGKPKTMC